MLKRLIRPVSVAVFGLVTFAITSSAQEIIVERSQLSMKRWHELHHAIEGQVRGESAAQRRSIEIREASGLGLSELEHRPYLEDLELGFAAMEKSALVLLAGGRASRLAQELSRPCPKALIDMKSGVPFDEAPPDGTTYLEFHFRQVARMRSAMRRELPVLVWTSDETHDEIVKFLSRKNYFGLASQTMVANIQELAPIFDLAGREINLPGVPQIGLGHGEIFSVLARPHVRRWLQMFGVERVMTTNVEGAVAFAPHSFVAHARGRPSLFTVFVVPKTHEDLAGGFLREIREIHSGGSTILGPWRPQIMESVEEGNSGLVDGHDFSTNTMIFDLNQTLAAVQEIDLPIAVEERQKDGRRYLQGKSGQAAAMFFLPSEEVRVVRGSRGRYLDYADQKNHNAIKSNGPRVLQASLNYFLEIEWDLARLLGTWLRLAGDVGFLCPDDFRQ